MFWLNVLPPQPLKKPVFMTGFFLFLKSMVRFLFGDVCFPVSSGCAEKCRNWNCLNKAKINFIFAEGIKSGSFCFVQNFLTYLGFRGFYQKTIRLWVINV